VAETGPPLAALALAAPVLAAPALAAPAVWAEEEDSTIGFYGCTKPTTTVAELPACAVKQGMAFRINKQFVGSQKIYGQKRKSYIC
jgi:hypothetical protein